MAHVLLFVGVGEGGEGVVGDTCDACWPWWWWWWWGWVWWCGVLGVWCGGRDLFIHGQVSAPTQHKQAVACHPAACREERIRQQGAVHAHSGRSCEFLLQAGVPCRTQHGGTVP